MTIYYYDRPPYYVVDADGEVSGLAVMPARRAFERAGIPYVLERTSVQRIFELMRSDMGLFCSPGWYRTDERARFAKFTRPILRDASTIGITRKSFSVPAGDTRHIMCGRGVPDETIARLDRAIDPI